MEARLYLGRPLRALSQTHLLRPPYARDMTSSWQVQLKERRNGHLLAGEILAEASTPHHCPIIDR